MRRLLFLSTIVAALVSAAPAAGQVMYNADVVVTGEVIPAPPGATAPSWFRVTVTNRGPDSIDAIAPRRHVVELIGLGAFEPGTGARCQIVGPGFTDCELGPLLPASASQTIELGVGEPGVPTDPYAGFLVEYMHPAIPGVPPWLNDPDWTNNRTLVTFGPPPGPGPLDGGPCTLAKLRDHPAFEGLARNSIAQLRRVALRKLHTARIDNLLACDTGRVVAKLTRLGRGGGVLATVDKEFAYSSAGRISPRLKLTRLGRRLAADPPARIHARATLKLYDSTGDVARFTTTFTMTRSGRAAAPR